MFTFKYIFILLLFAAVPLRAWIDFRGPMPSNFKRHFVEYEYDRLWRSLAPRIKNDHFTLTIICYQSANQADQPLARLLPEWGGGGAVGADTIILPVDKQPLLGRDAFQIAIHEMTHCIIKRAYPRVKVPRWFHEGTAMTLAGELDFREQIVLSQTAFSGTLMPLSAIDSVNTFPEHRAAVAYAQSHAAISFIIDKYGIDALPAILYKTERTGSFESAFKEEMGFDETEFSHMLDQEIRTRYSLLFIFGDEYLFWLIIALLFVGVGIFSLRRIALRKKQMDLQDVELDQEATIQVDENRPWDGPNDFNLDHHAQPVDPPPPTPDTPSSASKPDSK